MLAVLNRITSIETLHIHILLYYRDTHATVDPDKTAEDGVAFIRDRFATSPLKDRLEVTSRITDCVAKFILGVVCLSRQHFCAD